eukprot:SAG11_NODE_6266_length_1348_cov_1.131305_1_plen_276_part_00
MIAAVFLLSVGSGGAAQPPTVTPNTPPLPPSSPTQCKAAMAEYCSGSRQNGQAECAACLQKNSAVMIKAGCHARDFSSFCAIAPPPPWVRFRGNTTYINLLHNNTTPYMSSLQHTTTTSYSAVQFDPHTLSINTSDLTFAKVIPEEAQAIAHDFGEVRVCKWSGSLPAIVDLRDTPLGVDIDWVRKRWKGCGWQPSFDISCTNNNQQCRFQCTGACTECAACTTCAPLPHDPSATYCVSNDHRIQVVVVNESEYRKVFPNKIASGSHGAKAQDAL